jgi:hypothetical protein
VLGLIVMLDERRGRVCESLSLVLVGDCGASVETFVDDWFWRACWTGPRGPERVLGGRVEKWGFCSAVFVAEGWVCIEACGEPGWEGWRDLGVCEVVLGRWRLDTVRSFLFDWAARV